MALTISQRDFWAPQVNTPPILIICISAFEKHVSLMYNNMLRPLDAILTTGINIITKLIIPISECYYLELSNAIPSYQGVQCLLTKVQ
jgi:hypothetical protein